MSSLNQTVLSEQANPNPIEFFQSWFKDAQVAYQENAYAMILATATTDGIPSARVVVLRHYDEQGFVFYTNHDSRKGRELESNPRAAITFYWGSLGRQVRIGGNVERVSTEDSEAYFKVIKQQGLAYRQVLIRKQRPLQSKLSTWASPQSQVIPSLSSLHERVESLKAAYPDGNVPSPPFWGGYRVIPNEIEFWSRQENRLHDRIVYKRDSEKNTWVI
ncbi:1403_t:CDS:2, partial [Paraglomus occultum]